MKPRSVIIRCPIVREGNPREGHLPEAVVLDESPGGSLTPKEGKRLSSVPACPSVLCHCKGAGRARGEWACCGLSHLCPSALGSKPVTCQLQEPKMPELKGRVFRM